MLWAAVLGEVLALDDELPNELNDQEARSEELTEQPHLGRPSTDATTRPVLDDPGDGPEVGQRLVADALDDVDGGGDVLVVVHRMAGGAGMTGRRGRSLVMMYFIMRERERRAAGACGVGLCVCVPFFFRTARIHAETCSGTSSFVMLINTISTTTNGFFSHDFQL